MGSSLSHCDAFAESEFGKRYETHWKSLFMEASISKTPFQLRAAYSNARFVDTDHPLVREAPPVQYAVRYWDLAMSEKRRQIIQRASNTELLRTGIATCWMCFMSASIGALDRTHGSGHACRGASRRVSSKRLYEPCGSGAEPDPRPHGYQVWGYEVDNDNRPALRAA